MNRRFNFTGRRKIGRADARVTVSVAAEGPPAFSAELDLSEYGLPNDAPVFIEAYRQTSLMRFPWGTVGDARPADGCELTEFGTGEGVRFRVKVVESASGNGHGRPARLLAMADRLSPRRVVEAVEQAESLLAVEWADIEEVWRLQFDQDGTDEPILQISRRLVTDRQALVRSEQFVSLVLPEIFRSVLERVLLTDGDTESESSDDWRAQWLRMARRLPGMGAPPPADDDHREELEGWIESCVGAFARSFKTGRRFSEWWTGEEES
ncbi:MAG: hypothetical protein ACRDL7_03985 [Gaiellaceae bacterium]